MRAKLPAWDALEAQFRKGPPPFLRPGWKSPLLGKKIDLRWLDSGKFEHVKGSMDGWRDAKLLVIELWASYVLPLPSLPLALSLSPARTRAGDEKLRARGSSAESHHTPHRARARVRSERPRVVGSTPRF